MRRITARVELDGKEVVMTFLTNNFEWPPATIADLYRSRWHCGRSVALRAVACPGIR